MVKSVSQARVTFASLRDDQMGLNLKYTRHLQEPDAIYGSGRAADPYYEPWTQHDCLITSIIVGWAC